MTTETDTTYLKAEIRTPADKDFRAGWVPGAHLVVALMTPDVADLLGRLMIRSAATTANPGDEQDLIHGAIDLFTSGARATFLESPPHLVPVAKVDLPPSAADLDRRDQANITPAGAVLVETTYACICGERHRMVGDAFECPPDGRTHGPAGRVTT